jgi:hypothetical protein
VLNLAFIDDENVRKQQSDLYNNDRFSGFIQAIKPPKCMENMTKENGDFDRMNLPFKLSVQIMDSVIILS